MNKKIGIIGGGWLGKHCLSFLNENFEVRTTTTTQQKYDEFIRKNITSSLLHFSEEYIQKDWNRNFLDGLTTVMVCIPFSSRKLANQLEILAKNIIGFLGTYDGQLIICNSTAIYPNFSEIITENTFTDVDLHPGLRKIELLFLEQFPQTTILRLGGLMGDNRYLSKYTIKEPQQTVNHIHYRDICRLVSALISEPKAGEIYNVVAPEHPSKLEICTRELRGELIENPVREYNKVISPNKMIQDLSFSFEYPNPLYFKE